LKVFSLGNTEVINGSQAKRAQDDGTLTMQNAKEMTARAIQEVQTTYQQEELIPEKLAFNKKVPEGKH
jgi:hypothetical protein